MTKQQIEEYCKSAEFLSAKKKSDEEYASLVLVAAPVIFATDKSWFLLEFILLRPWKSNAETLKLLFSASIASMLSVWTIPAKSGIPVCGGEKVLKKRPCKSGIVLLMGLLQDWLLQRK